MEAEQRAEIELAKTWESSVNLFCLGLIMKHLSETALRLAAIINSFVKGGLNAEEFEHDYLQEFLDQNRQTLNDREYKILAEMFFAVEDYCKYPEIRDDDDLDERGLYDRACQAINHLRLLGS